MKLLLIIIGLLIPTTVASNTRNNTQSLGQDFYEESATINVENIPQDGYIEKKSINLARQTNVPNINEANMVNYNLQTETTTFEFFDTRSYPQKIPTEQSSSFRAVDSLKFEEENDREQILTKSIEMDGQTVFYTEGYNPALDSNLSSGVLNRSGVVDQRYQIINTKEQPYFRTGYILMRYDNIWNNVHSRFDTRYFRGTGFLEGPNLMVTAGHCVFGDVSIQSNDDTTYEDGINNPRFPDAIEFYPGAKDSSQINSSYSYYSKGLVINIDTNYFLNPTFEHDWAAVELDRDIGYYTGWHGKISNWYNADTEIRSHGYPGDKANRTMWEMYGNFNYKNDFIYRSNIFAAGGQSGSSFLMPYENGNTSTELACGILTFINTSNQGTVFNYSGGTRFNSFIFAYLNSFVTSHNNQFVKPSNYGFADAYPSDSETSTNFLTHNLNSNFNFRTRRYRTGYIQSEYVVMSSIRTGYSEAYIEFNFDVPVFRIDVDLTHWREYANEWLDKDSGVAELQTWHTKDWWNPFDTSRWVRKMDLLSDSTALPRDRSNPTTYIIKFSTPVNGFRFYSAPNTPRTSSSNRGRICIGDMYIYHN
jgi:V8-like Glu-specific endopeptidase